MHKRAFVELYRGDAAFIYELSELIIFLIVYEESVKQQGFPNTKLAISWFKLNSPSNM